MAIKAGDVAYIRTTDEPVFVLHIEIREQDHEHPWFDNWAVVRRPIGTDSAGISHSVEEFYLEELEDEDAHSKRRKGGLLNLFGNPGMMISGGDDTLASN